MQKHADYVPLHLHTQYSLLDGAIKIEELVETASGWRLPALAITDHGNLFGAVEFYKKTTKADIKPIIGAELYVAPKSRLDRQREESPFHLLVLAKDLSGYRNLLNLVSRAYTEGFYYKPRIDRALFEQYSGGLIALSACMRGEVPNLLMKDMKDEARQAALYYKGVLGPENYYIELQENGVPEQVELNRRLLEMARELHIKVVATNDCHYLRKEDARAHDILLCIQTGKSVNDPGRLRMQGDGLYFKSPAEMAHAFRDLPEALKNTVEIAERCNVEFDLKTHRLPKFDPPDGSAPAKFLEGLAVKGLKERFFAQEPPDTHKERLQMELSVIRKMGFESYFLIVWDFVSFAKKKGIPVGPGRGSAAGSLVAYCLGITELDPLKYGLIFERFLNPERISMPDIDVDFCKDGRQEVISYVQEKYGQEHVAQIITFGTLGARAAIRDVGRALDVPYQEVDGIAKLVPDEPHVSIKKALEMEPKLRELYEEKPHVKEIMDVAQRLEGLARHASTHAAGVVISPEPLTELAPLYKNPQDGTITTQFDMLSIDSMGLVKFDLLGLKTLTVIEKTLGLIKTNGGSLGLEDIALDDPKTYKLLSAGQSTGVFQLESAGMRDMLLKMGPERFEDLIALVALYRPGPLGSGMIEDFINRKKGKVPVKYDLPELRDTLDETYGVILYQEQVMQIAHKIAGFSLGQADILRKAMGKKLSEAMEKQKEDFVKGAKKNKIPEGKARRLFDLMAPFAEYGFNKSHSAAYAYLAYQTAYLKAHHPVEFMAATMSVELDNTEKITKHIKECHGMSVKVLPPDINLSALEFMAAGDSIRFGLGAVKGAGAQAIEAIIEARGEEGFGRFEDFLERINTKKVNRKVIEALIKAGAFDSTGATRRSCMEALETRDRGTSLRQQSIFGSPSGEGRPGLIAQEAGAGEWDEKELLSYEKEALGFYISGNPLRRYLQGRLPGNVVTPSGLAGLPEKAEVLLAGMVGALKRKKTKDNKSLMAYVTMDDEEASVEVVIFADLYKEKGELLKKGSPLLIKGDLEISDNGPKLLARQIMPLEEAGGAGNAPAKNGNGARRLEVTIGTSADLKKLKALVDAHGGTTALYLRLSALGFDVLVETPFGVSPDEGFLRKAKAVSGAGGEARFF